MKPVYLFIFLVIFCVTGCRDRQAMEELENLHARSAMEEQNKMIVKKWLLEVNKDNYEQLFGELWADDCKQILNSSRDTLEYEQFKELLAWLYTELPVITHEVHDIIARGDKVAAYFSARATHDVESFGVPATGRDLEWSAIAIFQLSDGRIQSRWEVSDMLGMYEQLGMKLQMNGTTEN